MFFSCRIALVFVFLFCCHSNCPAQFVEQNTDTTLGEPNEGYKSFVLFQHPIGEKLGNRKIPWAEGDWWIKVVNDSTQNSVDDLLNSQPAELAELGITKDDIKELLFVDVPCVKKHVYSPTRITENGDFVIGEVIWDSKNENFRMSNSTYTLRNLDGVILLDGPHADARLLRVLEQDKGGLSIRCFDYEAIGNALKDGKLNGSLRNAAGGSQAVTIVVDTKLELFLEKNKIRDILEKETSLHLTKAKGDTLTSRLTR